MKGRVDAVLFDFDGTLTLPGALDFRLIRDEMGCPAGTSILTFIERLNDPEKRAEAERILLRHELRAAETSRERPSAGGVLRFLRKEGLKTGIITRNTRASVLRAMKNCPGFTERDFDLIVSRDDPFPVKPEPDGVRHAASRFRTRENRMLVVGDYIYDIEAGNRAGAVTVYLETGPEGSGTDLEADFVIRDLAELIGILNGD